MKWDFLNKPIFIKIGILLVAFGSHSTKKRPFGGIVSNVSPTFKTSLANVENRPSSIFLTATDHLLSKGEEQSE